MRMHPIVMCGLPGSTIFFHIISQMVRFLKKVKVTEHNMGVLIFSTILSENFLILIRIERDITINVHWSSCKVLIIIVKLLIKL